MSASTTDLETVDGRIKSGKAAWKHIESEFLDVVDEIVATLVPEGPYAYTLPWDYTTDGTIPHQQFATDMTTLRAGYENLHRISVVRSMQAIAEVRTDWYVFCYGLGEGLIKPTGDIMFSPTAVLFPTMGETGITGELIWRRSSKGPPFTGGREGPLAAETACLAKHEAYLEALRRQDAVAAAALHHPGAQIGVRDYVTDSGTIAGMHSADEYREFLEKLFERYEILDVQMVERVVQDWFVFAELVWLVREKGGSGAIAKFHTIDIAEVRPDGLFASRIGHGTEVSAA
jgi:hypothetical protein